MSGRNDHPKFPYPDKKERKGNIHSLKTMAAVKVAVQLWKNSDDTFYSRCDKNFFIAYQRMEDSWKKVNEKVKKMILPPPIKKEIMYIMNFKFHIHNCMYYHDQKYYEPAELFEEEFWENQQTWFTEK